MISIKVSISIFFLSGSHWMFVVLDYETKKIAKKEKKNFVEVVTWIQLLCLDLSLLAYFSEHFPPIVLFFNFFNATQKPP